MPFVGEKAFIPSSQRTSVPSGRKLEKHTGHRDFDLNWGHNHYGATLFDGEPFGICFEGVRSCNLQ